MPEVVIHDYKRLKQVLLNLTFNALKYTEKGYVTVIVDCEFIQNSRTTLHSAPQCQIHFAISDSGCGIDKKKRLNMFDLFSSAKSNFCDSTSNSKDFIQSSELMGIGLAY